MPEKRKSSRSKSSATAVLEPVTQPVASPDEIVNEMRSSFDEVEVTAVAWRPSAGGMAMRRGVLGIILGLILLLPRLVGETQQGWISYALVFVIIGLSINILMGYAGQISLGHQAFVGVGAFTSALAVSQHHISFWVAFALAGATGALAALLLGLVALRLKGLFLALVTLAYGTLAQNTLFNWGALTGGGAGSEAPRPAGFTTAKSYDYLCMFVVALLMYVDWRLVRSKVGRAIFAIRENELSAASFGINITAYKLIAFVMSGIFAGFGGALFAHQQTLVVSSSFDFTLALTFVLMVVVGGLGSRVGVLIGSAFFAVFPLALASISAEASKYSGFIGAVLLLLTLTAFPGGIAQQLAPVLRWFGGGRLRGHHKAVHIATGSADVRP